MIVRIVRMEFQADKLEAFHQIFDQSKQAIRQFPGCLHLELHRDPQNEQVRYTYSHWEHEDALNAYRKSELFGGVWPATKALFAAKPKAFSLIQMETVE
ncbi:antibiotic biosynthesis monooxygenase family protein [Pontibacter sp. G13]|uniref:putative quinol monooxygenase n=1 Tax=Pontibacter sp. G13 TaxID=3074898 RepID=UPI002889C409|nr:antibiotic biosynthesis monooxygenase family protein [Pontibacter sp. G13]WNJ20874.1 antibiotic biosynthesis monooxygenase family protein [Pontibacter sp. G13]